MDLILAGFSGLIAALLVNYFADVLPAQRKLARPTCPKCGAPYGLRDYLLVASCKGCGAPRSWRTYITLAAGIIFSLVLWMNPPVRLQYWLGLVVLTYLAVVVVIDLEHRLIMHMVSLAGLLIGLIAGTVRTNLVNSLLGGLAGLGVMLLFYWFGLLFARYRARKLGHDDGEEALGFGDVTISAVLGLMLGWPLILYGLAIGILVGGLASLVLVLILVASKRYETLTVFTAYGPYLVFGAILLMYFPPVLAFLSGR